MECKPRGYYETPALHGAKGRRVSPHVISERNIPTSRIFFITSGVQHWHSMSDGVHIHLQSFGSISHTPHIWRSVFDVHTRSSDGLKPFVRGLDTQRGRPDINYTITYIVQTGPRCPNPKCLCSFNTIILSDQQTVSHLF